MNSAEIINKFRSYFINSKSIQDFIVNKLQINIANLDSEDILLVNKFRDYNEHKLELIENAKCELIFTNDDRLINCRRVIVISESLWIEFKTKLVHSCYNFSSLPPFIGITGTNGKTSTAHYLSSIALSDQKTILTVGTLGYLLNNIEIRSHNQTTPDIIDLLNTINEINQPIDLIVIEVSSHALDQERLLDLSLIAAIWTNFTQDHLDYHITMDNYFNSKLKILKLIKPDAKLYVLNDMLNLLGNHKNIFYVDLVQDNRLTTEFGIKNFSLAYKVYCDLFNPIKIGDIEIIDVPGRYNLFKTTKCRIVIDYAHTPDALKNVLISTKKILAKEGRVICVFGCGGDRDKSKRKIMGEIASENASIVVLTSDNPRSENPLDIINDISSGIHATSVVLIEPDRTAAIKQAYQIASKDDIVVVAGKGHEEYIEEQGVRRTYSDYRVIDELIKNE
jgi:UDP-N-acetylmuramoyl-L-alanyl-D-glutamate--2,6-diaminopimelate ligase